jgi:hypothetical protein
VFARINRLRNSQCDHDTAPAVSNAHCASLDRLAQLALKVLLDCVGTLCAVVAWSLCIVNQCLHNMEALYVASGAVYIQAIITVTSQDAYNAVSSSIASC